MQKKTDIQENNSKNSLSLRKNFINNNKKNEIVDNTTKWAIFTYILKQDSDVTIHQN